MKNPYFKLLAVLPGGSEAIYEKNTIIRFKKPTINNDSNNPIIKVTHIKCRRSHGNWHPYFAIKETYNYKYWKACTNRQKLYNKLKKLGRRIK